MKLLLRNQTHSVDADAVEKYDLRIDWTSDSTLITRKGTAQIVGNISPSICIAMVGTVFQRSVGKIWVIKPCFTTISEKMNDSEGKMPREVTMKIIGMAGLFCNSNVSCDSPASERNVRSGRHSV